MVPLGFTMPFPASDPASGCKDLWFPGGGRHKTDYSDSCPLLRYALAQEAQVCLRDEAVCTHEAIGTAELCLLPALP